MPYRACIALVDASRARLLIWERNAGPGGLRDKLSERRHLLHPAHRQRPGRPCALVERHDDAVAELDAELARTFAAELTVLVRSARAQRLILCASPHTLGKLRHVAHELRRSIFVDEVPRNLVDLAPDELCDQLTSSGLLPAPSRPIPDARARSAA
jgi:protein required for attachment to host cells